MELTWQEMKKLCREFHRNMHKYPKAVMAMSNYIIRDEPKWGIFGSEILTEQSAVEFAGAYPQEASRIIQRSVYQRA
jgi:hypothetical protein